MSYKIRTTCFMLLAVAAVAMAEDNPWVGTWKLDPSKSNFTGPTFKLEDAGGGKVRYTFGNDSYWFSTDGKEHPGLYGRMITVKQVDPNTRERTVRYKGKVLETVTSKVSDDGKTLTEDVKGTRPDGSTFSETDVYERVGDGSGFLGTWKTTKVQESSPGEIRFAANGSDGLMFDVPAYKAKCALMFDGKDHAATGPTVPKGLTLAATKKGDRSFDLVEKIQGKETYKGTYTVSDDGKTLTNTGSEAGTPEETTAVYVKQ